MGGVLLCMDFSIYLRVFSTCCLIPGAYFLTGRFSQAGTCLRRSHLFLYPLRRRRQRLRSNPGACFPASPGLRFPRSGFPPEALRLPPDPTPSTSRSRRCSRQSRSAPPVPRHRSARYRRPHPLLLHQSLLCLLQSDLPYPCSAFLLASPQEAKRPPSTAPLVRLSLPDVQRTTAADLRLVQPWQVLGEPLSADSLHCNDLEVPQASLRVVPSLKNPPFPAPSDANTSSDAAQFASL